MAIFTGQDMGRNSPRRIECTRDLTRSTSCEGETTADRYNDKGLGNDAGQNCQHTVLLSPYPNDS